MRGNLIPPLADVQLDHPVGVDGITLVGVDDNTEKTRVSLNKDLRCVACMCFIVSLKLNLDKGKHNKI